MKTIKSVAKIIALSFVTITMVSAEQPASYVPSPNKDPKSVQTIYQTMSTAQLQKEVEKRSKNGTVSFAMGMELIKRWSRSPSH